MAVCKNCGAEVGNAKFCTECGAPIEQPQQMNPVPSEIPVDAQPLQQTENSKSAPQPETPAAAPQQPYNVPQNIPHYNTPSYAAPQQPPYGAAQQTYTPYGTQQMYNTQQPYGAPPCSPPNKRSKKPLLFIGIGVIVLALIAVALYFFVIKPKQDSNTEKIGYYVLTHIKANGIEMNSSQLALFGMDKFYLYLDEDGTGAISLYGEEKPLTWDESKIVIDGDAEKYSLSGGVLTFKLDGDSMEFTRTDEKPSFGGTSETFDNTVIESNDTSTEENTFDKSFWVKDWYGWWLIEDPTGEFSDWGDGNWWDCCGRIKEDENGNYKMTLWDEDLPLSNPLAEVTLSSYTDSASSEIGGMNSDSGYFMDMKLGNGEWRIEPYYADYDNLIKIKGYYTAPEDPQSTFTYTIVLRPWGTEWDDWYADDDTCLPEHYASWYLPLIREGVTKAPATIESESQD